MYMEIETFSSTFLCLRSDFCTMQRFGRIGICQTQRQLQRPLHSRYGCSVQVTLVLMLTIFLFG